MESVLKIAKWEEVFETAESRRHKVLSWVSLPVGFQSHGYQSLVDDFGDDAPAIYGAWCALIALAATMPTRGVLASSRGVPISLASISRQTFFPADLFRRLIDWAKKPEISWLVEVTSHRPELHQPNTGLQDPTQPNKTSPNPTQPNRRTGSSEVKIFLDWGLSDWTEEKKRFCRLGSVSPAILPTKTMQLLIAVGLSTGDEGRELLSGIAERLRSGGVRKPKAYCESSLRKFADDSKIDLSLIDEKIKSIIPEITSINRKREPEPKEFDENQARWDLLSDQQRSELLDRARREIPTMASRKDDSRVLIDAAMALIS